MILVEEALSSDFEIEPEPEKPREWWVHPRPGGLIQHTTENCAGRDDNQIILVHDADACDRLRRVAPTASALARAEQVIEAWEHACGDQRGRDTTGSRDLLAEAIARALEERR